jgi:hypothetical protein
MALQAEILKQIDAVLTSHRELRLQSQYDDCSDHPESVRMALIATMADTINRLAPPNSYYVESARALLHDYGHDKANVIAPLAGILSAMRKAYDAGYLATVSELIHADVFADFVEMAAYLLSEGYKDPAAVVIGSVLEEHLRQLSVKNGILTSTAGKPKTADQLNADLAGKGAYSKLDQKSITSWLDLRNKAAHGKYGEYTKEQVDLMLQGIQNFMARVPA